MALYRSYNLSQEQLLAIAANMLDKAFLDSSRVLAKRRYQALEKGNRVFLINVALEKGNEVAVDVRLNRSELRNKLNFSTFRHVVALLLGSVARVLDTKQPVQAFSSEDKGRWMYLIPAVLAGEAGEDMMILGLDTRIPGSMTLELLFIDPAQFAAKAG